MQRLCLRQIPCRDAALSPYTPGENPSEGAAAPFLVAGVRVSKGRGESKRLALWRVFRPFLYEQKGTAGSGRAGPENSKSAPR